MSYADEFDYSMMEACAICYRIDSLDHWGYCSNCSWGDDAVDALIDDEEESAVMPSLVDVAYDLEACRDALRDLGEHSLASYVTTALRKVDDAIISREDNIKPLIKEIKKKKKKAGKVPAKAAAPVIELRRAMSRRKEEA